MHTCMDVFSNFFCKLSSGSQPPQLTSTTIEIMMPQALISHVYGENNSNLNQIRQVGLHVVLLVWVVRS